MILYKCLQGVVYPKINATLIASSVTPLPLPHSSKAESHAKLAAEGSVTTQSHINALSLQVPSQACTSDPVHVVLCCTLAGFHQTGQPPPPPPPFPVAYPSAAPPLTAWPSSWC